MLLYRKEPIPKFHPEFGRFMLEATPGKPWGSGFKDLLMVESNMKWRCVCSTVRS
jgi:glutamate--cysteine ligase catalytic subunit